MRSICLLAALGALAACTGTSPAHETDIKPTLSFATLDNATIERLVNAAAAADVFSAQNEVEQYSTSSGTACPVIGAFGETVTLTGGCTDAGGVMLEGDARIDNPISWEGVPYDSSQPTIYTFQQLTATTPTSTQSFDGVVSFEHDLSIFEADLDTTIDGVKVRSDLYVQCTSAGNSQTSCRLSTSGIELSGQGGALASGTIIESSLGSDVTADLTLQGADTLTASISAGCTSWKLSDSANAKTCP